NVGQLAVLGQGAGSLAGLVACSQVETCQTVIALDPLVAPEQPLLEQALAAAGERALLMLAGEDQPNALQVAQRWNINAAGQTNLQVYPQVDPTSPGILSQLVLWLRAYVASDA
ncbi:MAG: hypothetical protein HC915_18710, partial [Anaerolineae bacterium]|nr:hypothetical protein [Anaerolineae bacterium]